MHHPRLLVLAAAAAAAHIMCPSCLCHRKSSMVLASAFITAPVSLSSSTLKKIRRMSPRLQVKNDGDISTTDNLDDEGTMPALCSRRSVLQSAVPSVLALAALSTPAHALVKGNAPPPKSSPPGSSSEKKCRNVEECQEQAERAARLKAEEEAAAATPPRVAPGGSRYKDMVEGAPAVGAAGSSEAARVAKAGDRVEIRYKILKLGKRSYDGLSGEGTVVFSRGKFV